MSQKVDLSSLDCTQHSVIGSVIVLPEEFIAEGRD